MAAFLGHDVDYTLWVKCDRCGDQMMLQLTEAAILVPGASTAWEVASGNPLLRLDSRGPS